MTGEEFLVLLQSEAEESGFHRRLKIWVDDKSSVAKALLEFDQVEVGRRYMEHGPGSPISDVEAASFAALDDDALPGSTSSRKM